MKQASDHFCNTYSENAAFGSWRYYRFSCMQLAIAFIVLRRCARQWLDDLEIRHADCPAI